MEEKSQLASLNDRLAAYIERVRSLEFENERLVKIISSYEESSTSDSSKIKSMYEGELADARRLLDQMGKEKAKVQLELNKVRSDYDDLQAKYAGKERAFGDAEKRLLSLESQLNNLQARLSDANAFKRQMEEEMARLKKEFDQGDRQLQVARKQLEDETMKRVDLENRIQSLREQLSFQKEVHEEELNNSAAQKRGFTLEMVDLDQKRDFDSEMADALRQMREENEDHINQSRLEIEVVFQKKLADLQDASGHWQGEARRSQTEVMQLKSRIEGLSSDLDKLNSKADNSAGRISYLERLLQEEKDKHASSVAVKDSEIRRLKLQLEEQLQEYRDLFDLKIQLDVEISAYRKLLDIEENRLNISPSKMTGVTSSSSGGRAGKKRKLGEGVVGGFTDSFAEFSSSSSFATKGGVSIQEVDGEGRFVKLQNSTDKDVSLVGWVVSQSGELGQEVTYKFIRGASIKPRQTLTVWSHDKAVSHGVNDLVTKNHQWLKTDLKKTLLIDNYGEEITSKES